MFVGSPNKVDPKFQGFKCLAAFIWDTSLSTNNFRKNLHGARGCRAFAFSFPALC